MMPASGLRLDSPVPVPGHVVVGRVDEPVHRHAREASLAEELLLKPAGNPSAAALSGLQPFALMECVRLDWLQCIRQSDEGRMT